jgi:hypothetical protein
MSVSNRLEQQLKTMARASPPLIDSTSPIASSAPVNPYRAVGTVHRHTSSTISNNSQASTSSATSIAARKRLAHNNGHLLGDGPASPNPSSSSGDGRHPSPPSNASSRANSARPSATSSVSRKSSLERRPIPSSHQQPSVPSTLMISGTHMSAASVMISGPPSSRSSHHHVVPTTDRQTSIKSTSSLESNMSPRTSRDQSPGTNLSPSSSGNTVRAPQRRTVMRTVRALATNQQSLSSGLLPSLPSSSDIDTNGNTNSLSTSLSSSSFLTPHPPASAPPSQPQSTPIMSIVPSSNVSSMTVDELTPIVFYPSNNTNDFHRTGGHQHKLSYGGGLLDDAPLVPPTPPLPQRSIPFQTMTTLSSIVTGVPVTVVPPTPTTPPNNSTSSYIHSHSPSSLSSNSSSSSRSTSANDGPSSSSSSSSSSSGGGRSSLGPLPGPASAAEKEAKRRNIEYVLSIRPGEIPGNTIGYDGHNTNNNNSTMIEGRTGRTLTVHGNSRAISQSHSRARASSPTGAVPPRNRSSSTQPHANANATTNPTGNNKGSNKGTSKKSIGKSNGSNGSDRKSSGDTRPSANRDRAANGATNASMDRNGSGDKDKDTPEKVRTCKTDGCDEPRASGEKYCRLHQRAHPHNNHNARRMMQQ